MFTKQVLPHQKIRPVRTDWSRFIRKPLDSLDPEKLIFYDIETTHQFAPYTQLRMCAAAYGWGDPFILRTKGEWKEFRRRMADPSYIKVQFNGVNFDDIVLDRFGIDVHPQNRHDLFLILKTISPNLPGFSLKFASFYFLGDPHFPEADVIRYMSENKCQMHEVPYPILARYNKHDVVQTQNLFRLGWDVVIRKEHWRSYHNRLFMGEPLLEMETEGGIYLDPPRIWKRLRRLHRRVQLYTNKAITYTQGQVQNPNSSKQLGEYLSKIDKIELELTDSGEFCVKKSVLVSLMDDNPLARYAFKIREANGTIKYYENYLNALEDETYEFMQTESYGWIPVQFSNCAAGTGRFTSQSLYRLNFQNPNEAAKAVQIIPEGQLGWWFDATQIENVVHIYESGDDVRRKAYEADPDWNEYVWLCNEICGTNKTKDELDDKEHSRSVQIPHWTIYKQYKTGKLGLNFGMGEGKFGKFFGLSTEAAHETFADIHRGCPTIRQLQSRVAYDLEHKGYVEDVFGCRYSGPPRMAYKVVAYLIQGCGTGSLPRAQIRANWETLRSFDDRLPRRLRRTTKAGHLCVTTHDENGGRINLALGPERILQLLQKLNYNMTKKFSPLFGGIPLRAKMYLSRTTAAEAKEVKITDIKTIMSYIEK